VRQYPNYLCIFHANPDVHDDVVDKGLDPDFRPPLPTWGICQPGKRHSVDVGDHIVFVGYYEDSQRYLVKGWMRVGEKINYLDALQRFGNRPNVIIREAKLPIVSAPARWTNRHKALREETLRRYGTDSPAFLTTIECNGQAYVQLDRDDHQIDNWKCQRMFLCTETQLKACITTGACLREQDFPTLTDYIVAASGEWQDVGPRRRDWFTVAPPRLQGRSLRTPCNQHNVRGLFHEEFAWIKDKLSQ